MTKAAIKAVIVKNSGKNADEIATAIYALELIESSRRHLEKKREDVRRRMEKELKEVAEFAALQKSCEHPAARYEGDPSGGSDSCHSCYLCGKQW